MEQSLGLGSLKLLYSWIRIIDQYWTDMISTNWDLESVIFIRGIDIAISKPFVLTLSTQKYTVYASRIVVHKDVYESDGSHKYFENVLNRVQSAFSGM